MYARATALGVSLLVMFASAGCYLAHERGAPTGESPDAASARDAGPASDADASSFDARTSPDTMPAFDDAGPLIPSEPDPDLGPDARPSDYDGGTWTDPPVLGPSDPCCTLADPIRITGRDEGVVLEHTAPAIAWGPGLWGLLTTQQSFPPTFEVTPRAVVFELAADGTPIGNAHVMDRPIDHTGPLVWAEGRWAIAAYGDGALTGDTQWHTRLLDRDLRAATDWLDVGPAGSDALGLARFTTGDRWAALRSDTELVLSAFSDDGLATPTYFDVTGATGRVVRAAGLRSRAAMLVGRGPGQSSSLVVVGAPPSYATLGTIPLASASYWDHAALAALQDVVVATSMDETQAYAEVIDPFAMRAIGPPLVLGTAAAVRVGRSLDVAGSSKLGVAGVCWASHSEVGGARDATSSIDFRLVGTDGLPRGAAVRVIEAPFRGGEVTCSVGTDELGFLVAWWDGSSLWVRRIAIAE